MQWNMLQNMIESFSSAFNAFIALHLMKVIPSFFFFTPFIAFNVRQCSSVEARTKSFESIFL